MSNELATTLDVNQWEIMQQQGKMLVETGFLPEAIKTPQQAIAIMLKGRELGLPAMYALSNIVVIKGKPSANAELMLSLIYRDHGDDAAMWDENATNEKVATLLYKRRGWPEYRRYAFTIEDAARAGLTGNATWKQYPGAMLRARCISAVARMAFPDSIGGMYTPEELGQGEIETMPTARRSPISSYVPDDEAAIGIAEAEYAVSEVIDTETGELTTNDGVSPIDELLAKVHAATTLDQLDAIRAEKNANGINDQTLSDAWRRRFLELGGKGKAKTGEQPLLEMPRRTLIEASGV